MPDTSKAGLQALKQLFGEINVAESPSSYIIHGGSFPKFPFEEEGENTKRKQAMEEISAPFEALVKLLKEKGCHVTFAPNERTNDNITHCGFTVPKTMIDNFKTIEALRQIKPEDIGFSQSPEYSPWERAVRDHFNHHLGPTKWKIIDTEAGRAISTMQPVSNPAAVVGVLGGLFDTEFYVANKPGPIIIPLALLDNIAPARLSDKIRGLNLGPELRPYRAQRTPGE